MRICVVTTGAHGVGGKQRHTHDLVAGLTARGLDVEVICPAGDGLHPDLHEARWHLLDVRGAFQAPEWQRASHEAFAAAHAERPFDVVHGEGSAGLGLLRHRDDRLAPLVVEFHGNYVGLVRASLRRARSGVRPAVREARYLVALSRKHFTRGNARGFRRCEAIVPSHQQVRDTIRSHALDPRRVHVVPNGVDADLWRPRPKPPRERPLLVASGRLNREKGFDLAIRALADLDAELHVAGSGDEERSLRRLAEDRGVADRVRFLGPKPADELARLVAEADVYLFPTLREEAAPLVVPEAMSCGVPVVASRIGGIPEVISKPGANGILVTPGDVGALVEETRRLLGDEKLRRAMGAAARERVLEEYTVDRMLERTLEVYELAIERSGRPLEPAASA